MIIGIVGAEGAKFTALGEKRAKDVIESLVLDPMVTNISSGHCHLGGVDIWAEQLGEQEGYEDMLIFPPKDHNWNTGYKPRNMQIVRASDKVYCIVVDKLPPDFNGMTFKECYHCRKAGWPPTNHVKSGGCWTMHKAIEMGRQGELIIVENY